MLPLIQCDFGALCHREPDFFGGGGLTVIGQTYAISWDVLETAASEGDSNVDRVICIRVLAGLAKRPLRSSFLVTWASHQGMVLLTVSDAHDRVKGLWLMDVPGYRESGRQRLPQGSLPYLYWDGERLSRLHRLFSPPEEGDRFLVDLGCFGGPLVSPVEPDTWQGYRDAPGRSPDYAAVPNEPNETFKVGRRELTLYHGWWPPDRVPDAW
jgi:hypothetical protein